MLPASLDLDDVILAFSGEISKMPFGDRGFASGHALQKNTDRHDEGEPSHCDVHLPVSNFVFGDTFHENRQRLWHSHTRLLSQAAGIAREFFQQVNIPAFIGVNPCA